MKKAVSVEMVMALLMGMLALTSSIHCPEPPRPLPPGTIRIRADGSVDPPTANISTADNVTYALDDNINNCIEIERSNIIIDGKGYTVLAPSFEGWYGLHLSGINNVTIKNTNIKGFDSGIEFDFSSNNSIVGNNITTNKFGIWLHGSSNCSIFGNTFVNDGLLVDSYYWNVVSDNVAFGNVVSGNLVNGKPLVYFESVSDCMVENAGQVILVNCSGVRVHGLDLCNTTVGVELWKTNNTSISGNHIANNYDGIRLDGSNCSISGNNITTSKDHGIYLYDSSNCSIFGNNIENNYDGIGLFGSSDNSFFGNNITASKDRGIQLLSSNNNMMGNNITANKFYGIELFGSNNSISGNHIADNGYGMWLHDSSNNSISGNNMTDNFEGIRLDGSSSNSIFGNSITTNKDHGIELSGSSNNSIYHNNFDHNNFGGRQVGIVGSHDNSWDDGYPSGGNYWSDYNGTDSNHDGIGDSPYIIDANNKDNYPQMTPYQISEFPSLLILPLFMMAMATLLAVIFYRKNHRHSQTGLHVR